MRSSETSCKTIRAFVGAPLMAANTANLVLGSLETGSMGG